MSILSAFRVVGKKFTAFVRAFVMVGNMLIKTFCVPSLMSGTSQFTFIRDCCRCFFVSLSLYVIAACSSRCEGTLNLFKQLCDSSGNLAFATSLRLVLGSSRNHFEHREHNLVLRVQMVPLPYCFSCVFHVFHCFLMCPNGFPMVFLCMPLFS